MNVKSLEKTYNPLDFEDKWYSIWTEKGYFKANINADGEPYCIVIPPPNVTGSLHMGHALNNTLQDILIRYKRMKGFRTLWQFGMDHAGIATQNVVERQLASENKTRFDLGRDEFVSRVWTWKEEFGGIIINQLKKLGASCDWDRERFTMDEGCSKAVRKVFTELYNKGMIYRGNKLINWCPRCRTALSDLEVEHEDINGNLYHVKYPAPDGKEFLVVATTRPETMLGDTAVAVNPEDKRYEGWKDRDVLLPLMNRTIPVIADDYVDIEFGTGALKITPAHDPNDFEIGKKYKLDLIKVIGDDGTMTEDAGIYAGLDRFEARKRVVEDLEKEGLLVKIESHQHAVGHCYRCKNIVEPNLSMQWFVDVRQLAAEAIDVVKTEKIRLIPKNWEKTYFEWMNNIRDWCISRQIWWGHRIPAWFCDKCGKITVDESDPDKCVHCGHGSMTQETDVLDTWFSSALWPFSTLGWPEKTREVELFYPTACLVTGFDILFFWVARMIMMGLNFMDDIPFRDVYVHALVRDSHGQKMSKSKGNVIDPLKIIDRFGADSFRFTLAAMAAQGRDVRLSEDRIEGYRHFVNKIWNASRFVLMNLDDYEPGDLVDEHLQLKDRWILSRLSRVIKLVQDSIEGYRFNDTAHHLYQFVWHEFCDWYLEMAKPSLYGKDNEEVRVCTQHVIVKVLRTILELLHPVMPFVTEEIWQKLPHEAESIVITPYPEPDPASIDQEAESHMDYIIRIVTAIRNIRSEMNVLPSSRPTADILCREKDIRNNFASDTDMLCTLAGLEAVNIHEEFQGSKTAATAVVDKVEIYLCLEGIIDFAGEVKRLEKEISKVVKDLEFVKQKLSNEDFLNRAPDQIVSKEKEKAEKYREKEAKLRQNIERVKKLCL